MMRGVMDQQTSCKTLIGVHEMHYNLQDGWTAIYNAALAGNSNIVKVLIDHGAKVDLRDTVCVNIKLDY